MIMKLIRIFTHIRDAKIGKFLKKRDRISYSSKSTEEQLDGESVQFEVLKVYLYLHMLTV